MRLGDDQIQVLKSKLNELSSSAKLYLFGSRVDDTKKGGDIDLLVLNDGHLNDPFVKSIFPKAVLL